MTRVIAFDDASLWPVLLVAPLLALLLRRHASRRVGRLTDWGGAVTASLAETVTRRAGTVLFLAAVARCSVAVVGPRWGDAGAAPAVVGMDVMVCLDVSRSMEVMDLDPNRLEFARWQIRRLAANARGHRLGLVVFAGEARLVCPLTRDMDAFATILDRVGPFDVRRGGTDIGAALNKASEALERGSSGSGRIILITDGEDLTGEGRIAARKLGQRGLRVDCLGVGTPAGGRIPLPEGGWLKDRAGRWVVSRLVPDTLKAIVEPVGGVYRSSGTSSGELQRLFNDGGASLAVEGASESAPRRLVSRRRLFVLAALLCLWTELALVGVRRR